MQRIVAKVRVPNLRNNDDQQHSMFIKSAIPDIGIPYIQACEGGEGDKNIRDVDQKFCSELLHATRWQSQKKND